MSTSRSALFSAFLVMGMAANASCSNPKHSEDDAPLADISRLAREGRLNGVTLEYWVGGGPPPPLYRSDQFRLLTIENRDLLEFDRPFHDPIHKREGLVEKFQLAAEPSDIRRLANLILQTGVFARRYPEEKESGRADALTTEVVVTVRGREFKRRYFSGSPKPLEPLRIEVERLVRRVLADGQRSVVFQGKPLAGMDVPPEANSP